MQGTYAPSADHVGHEVVHSAKWEFNSTCRTTMRRRQPTNCSHASRCYGMQVVCACLLAMLVMACFTYTTMVRPQRIETLDGNTHMLLSVCTRRGIDLRQAAAHTYRYACGHCLKRGLTAKRNREMAWRSNVYAVFTNSTTRHWQPNKMQMPAVAASSLSP